MFGGKQIIPVKIKLDKEGRFTIKESLPVEGQPKTFTLAEVYQIIV
jgi:hypothetical protein